MIYIDTNIFVYLFEDHPDYGEKVAEMISSWQTDNQFFCSTLTVAECLAKVTEVTIGTFHELPGLHIIPVDETIAVEAGRLQRIDSLRIGDAIHLATAITRQATNFFTNDRPLAKIASKYISVKSIAR